MFRVAFSALINGRIEHNRQHTQHYDLSCSVRLLIVSSCSHLEYAPSASDCGMCR